MEPREKRRTDAADSNSMHLTQRWMESDDDDYQRQRLITTRMMLLLLGQLSHHPLSALAHFEFTKALWLSITMITYTYSESECIEPTLYVDQQITMTVTMFDARSCTRL